MEVTNTKLFCWDDKLVLMKEKSVEKPKDWCYFCNSKQHGGRTCPFQMSAINPNQLDIKIIMAFDRSTEGTLELGSNAPNSRVMQIHVDQKNEVDKIRNLLDFTSGSIPLVINFGSAS